MPRFPSVFPILSRVATGLHVAAFALACLVASPVILSKFGVDFVRDRIESRWPDSDRARAVSFWFGLMTPIILVIALSVLLPVVAARSGKKAGHP